MTQCLLHAHPERDSDERGRRRPVDAARGSATREGPPDGAHSHCRELFEALPRAEERRRVGLMLMRAERARERREASEQSGWGAGRAWSARPRTEAM